MLVSGQYGGEVIYRVYLFALPGMSILFADLLFGAENRWWRRRVIGLVVCVGLTLSFLFAYFGRDFVNMMHAGEPQLAEWVDSNAPAGSLVATAFPNVAWPQRGDYTRFVTTPVALTSAPPRTAQTPSYSPQELCDIAYAWKTTVPEGRAYVIISDSQMAYAVAHGYAQALTVGDLTASMATCGVYQLRFQNQAGSVWEITRGEGTVPVSSGTGGQSLPGS